MPNTREKLVELVDDYTDHLSMQDIHKADFAEKFTDHLIAHGVTVQDNTEISDELLQQLRNAPITILHEEPTIELVQEWISVKDRLPEYEQQVLTYRGESGISIERMFPGAFWDFDYDIIDKVTHWMPLPPAPEDMK